MGKNVSAVIAQGDAEKGKKRSRSARVRTRYPGVYSRTIVNRQGKEDTAYDVCYRMDGKLCWQTIGYTSNGVNAAYASQKRAVILAGLETGEVPAKKQESKAMTIAEAWELFFEKTKDSVTEPENYERRYRKYISQFAKKRLDQIKVLDLEDFKIKMLKSGLAVASVVKVLSDIRRMYRKLIAWGVYDGPVPTDGLSFPKADNARTRYLSRSEAQQLLTVLQRRSKIWHDIAWMSLYTGMRLGEILHLKGEHLDFNGTGQILIKDAKTGSRTVAMTPEVRDFLFERKPKNPRFPVFQNVRGEPSEAIRRDSGHVFRRAVKECGLNDGISDNRHRVVFHTLRHTFCSWLAIAGVPLYTIGKIVGHATTQMTQRYSHLCPDARAAAAMEIGKVMRGESHTG